MINKLEAKEIIKNSEAIEIRPTETVLKELLESLGFNYDEERREKTLISLLQDIKTDGYVCYNYDPDNLDKFDYAVLAEKDSYLILLNSEDKCLVYKW